MSMNWRRMKRELLADKRKLGLAVTLVAFGLLLWTRLLFYSNVPRVATAGPDKKKALAQGQEKGEEEKSHGPSVGIRKTVEIELASDVKKDLFAMDPAYFPPISTGKAKAVSQAPKSGPDPVDEKQRELEARISRVTALAKGMKLETTLVAEPRKALINGKLVDEGGEVNGFKVLRISERSVLVEREGISVELNM